MTSILAELQAGYDQRAQMALEAPVSPSAAKITRKATRTYSGQALERRRQWGRNWAYVQRLEASKLLQPERN